MTQVRDIGQGALRSVIEQAFKKEFAKHHDLSRVTPSISWSEEGEFRVSVVWGVLAVPRPDKKVDDYMAEAQGLAEQLARSSKDPFA